ncbi:hypothetical protein DOZ80_18150 [Pseudomonas fluorescens]|uniref:Uncharacterized protein n=1 Tax=Pseudomonas fluorescens TaxID=294 RepID=A0A327N0Q5_PSEFL|nr:hypothetical protein DOZ80_18150 [Pseudomonas fluorescens]
MLAKASVNIALVFRTPSLASQLLQGGNAYGSSIRSAALFSLLLLLLLLIFLPPREAEHRFCAVGNPAWMPG